MSLRLFLEVAVGVAFGSLERSSFETELEDG